MPVPPRPSYRISSPSIIATPHLSRLEDPVRINFDSPWQRGAPLFDWYHRRSSRLISTLQLRREDESPFFHEYIVFSLGSNGGYFRVDRRQKPDESAPLDCIYKEGVEAYDTIEEINSLEDRTYCSSQCLVSINFSQGVPLALLLSVARVIQQHKNARIYTLQRYNCYFFAQTIMVCIARVAARGRCGTIRKYEAQLLRKPPRQTEGGHESEGVDSLGPLKTPDRLARRRMGVYGSLHWASARDPEDGIDIRAQPDRVRVEPRPPSEGFIQTRWWRYSRPQEDYTERSTFNQTLSYIECLIDEHSARVERYKVVLKCSAKEASSDIKTTMQDIAREISG